MTFNNDYYKINCGGEYFLLKRLLRVVFSIESNLTHTCFSWFFAYLCMTAMVYTGVNIFPTFGTKKSKMEECKNITSIFIKIVQRKKNTPPLTEKDNRCLVFLCIYKNLLLYLSMIFETESKPTCSLSNFSCKGYSPNLAKNKLNRGGWEGLLLKITRVGDLKSKL